MNRLDGGITGFFQHVEKGWFFYRAVGPWFHGKLLWDGRTVVVATADAIIADSAQQYIEKYGP